MIFNLELGQVPTINKETLSRKVTMALSEKAKAGDHDYNINDAKDTIDDVLSCAKLELVPGCWIQELLQQPRCYGQKE